MRSYHHLTANYVDSSPHIIHVDPEIIIRETRTYWGDLLDQPGLILGGPWDMFATKFNERQKVKALNSRLVDGIDWDETDYYERILQRIENGRSWRGCLNKNDLDIKLSEYEYINDKVAKQGYKSQKEMHDIPQPGENRIGEIGVNVGRDGELFWHDDGQSRLTIAKIQGIDKVPVEVLTRHKKWWTLKCEVESCDSMSDLSQNALENLDHPDLPSF